MSSHNIKFELAEINTVPFLFFSNYQKDLEVDWNEQRIKSYSQHETKRRVYQDSDDSYYFFDSNNVKQFIPETEVIRYEENFYYNEQTLVLQNESYFKKSNKYLIMFLKLAPLFLVFFLSFRMPIDFTSLFNINNTEVGFLDIFDISKLFAFAIACFLVYMGYRFREQKAPMVFFLAIVYFLLFYLSLNFSFFVHLNRDLLTALIFVWASVQAYFIYERGHFDEYYSLLDITKGTVLYRKRLLGKIGIGERTTVWAKFRIGGYFMRIIK